MKPVPIKQRLGMQDPAETRAAAQLLRHMHKEIESTISGVSMGTTIPDGSTIRISCDHPEDMSVGQVMAFLDTGGLVAHRFGGLGHGGSRSRCGGGKTGLAKEGASFHCGVLLKWVAAPL